MRRWGMQGGAGKKSSTYLSYRALKKKIANYRDFVIGIYRKIMYFMV